MKKQQLLMQWLMVAIIVNVCGVCARTSWKDYQNELKIAVARRDDTDYEFCTNIVKAFRQAGINVLDYLTMAYCLDHDIPILGFCRGSQMLCMVSVATMIQDFPVWFASHNLDYNYEHRREISEGETYFDYTPHDVNIASDSHSQICSPPRR